MIQTTARTRVPVLVQLGHHERVDDNSPKLPNLPPRDAVLGLIDELAALANQSGLPQDLAAKLLLVRRVDEGKARGWSDAYVAAMLDQSERYVRRLKNGPERADIEEAAGDWLERALQGHPLYRMMQAACVVPRTVPELARVLRRRNEHVVALVRAATREGLLKQLRGSESWTPNRYVATVQSHVYAAPTTADARQQLYVKLLRVLGAVGPSDPIGRVELRLSVEGWARFRDVVLARIRDRTLLGCMERRETESALRAAPRVLAMNYGLLLTAAPRDETMDVHRLTALARDHADGYLHANGALVLSTRWSLDDAAIHAFMTEDWPPLMAEFQGLAAEFDGTEMGAEQHVDLVLAAAGL